VCGIKITEAINRDKARKITGNEIGNLTIVYLFLTSFSLVVMTGGRKGIVS
jgi:hypothetical protein